MLALPDGSVLVSDTRNHCIRRIGADAARAVTTFAGRLGDGGFADGPATAARLSPQGGPLWADGRLLVSDGANGAIRILSP